MLLPRDYRATLVVLRASKATGQLRAHDVLEAAPSPYAPSSQCPGGHNQSTQTPGFKPVLNAPSPFSAQRLQPVLYELSPHSAQAQYFGN